MSHLKIIPSQKRSTDRLFRRRSSCITSANQQCIARSSSSSARAKSGCQSTEPKFQFPISKLSALDSLLALKSKSSLDCIFYFCIHAARAKSPFNARVLRLIKLARALLYSPCLARSAAFLIGRVYVGTQVA